MITPLPGEHGADKNAETRRYEQLSTGSALRGQGRCRSRRWAHLWPSGSLSGSFDRFCRCGCVV
jgi:hypothetical protein